MKLQDYDDDGPHIPIKEIEINWDESPLPMTGGIMGMIGRRIKGVWRWLRR